MNDRDAVIWLHRRAGFGLAGAELDQAAARGPAAELERLLQPLAAAAPDPWDDTKLPMVAKDNPSRLYAIDAWLDQLVATDVPLVDRIAWLWHGHFVSGLDKVKIGRLMVDQIRLFRAGGLGSFAELLRSITIDPAMMIYLDLRTSTGSDPNENYAREVLELFTLGSGEFTESDVHAGAIALTGWRLQQGTVKFSAGKHDDTPQTYLGVDRVHDLDTVVDAIVAQPAMATFVCASIATDLLGDVEPSVIAELASGFVTTDLDLRQLVRATLTAGLAGAGSATVLAPVPWMAAAQRVTGARFDDAGQPTRQRLQLLRDAGQLPMRPPNVAGWPGGPAWFGAGSLVARSNLAALIAGRAAPDSAALIAAGTDDPAALADAIGLPSSGFGPATAAALRTVTPGAQRLALALVSPEFVLV